MDHDGEPARGQRAGADVAIVFNCPGNRNADLDLKLPCHVDDVIPEERRASWRDTTRAKPAEDLGNAVRYRADGRPSLPALRCPRMAGLLAA